MSDTAVLIEEIRSLPPDLAAEALDFVGYLKQKCRKDAPEAGKAAALPPEGETHTGGSRDTPEYLRRKAMEAQSIEYINRHADELNREAAEVFKDQVDIFELGSPFTEDDFVLPLTGGETMKRGELYRVYRGNRYDPKNFRVYLVVSRQTVIDNTFSSVICAPVYSKYGAVDTQVGIGVEEGMKHDSAVYCDDLASIPKSLLTDYIGSLSAAKMEAVNAALRIALAV